MVVVVRLRLLAAIVVNVARVPGLGALLPARPEGRGPCLHCGGTGKVRMAGLELGCTCGGLGWEPLTTEELGIQPGLACE